MEIEFRGARAADLAALVAMLADDPLGRGREQGSDSLDPAYRDAFDAIDADPDHTLLLATVEGEIAAMLQLSFIPHLTHTGAWRAQIEGVRVAAPWRGRGVGSRLLREALKRARERGCRLAQLTTDRRRADARRFYERLGFVATHDGMKLALP